MKTMKKILSLALVLTMALGTVASCPIAATAEEISGASLASGAASDSAFAIASWVSE